MEPNSINIINQIAESQAVWAILFITLAYYFLKQSEKRENKLLEELHNLTEANKTQQANQVEHSKEMVFALREISKTLNSVEVRIDNLEKVTYKGDEKDEKN